jgi:chemotaxis response regulator CheB
VIVRISGTGQYRLADNLASRLNDLDNVAVKAVESGDEPCFIALFREMVDLVRSEGEELPADDLSPSDVILPPADTTLAEAAADFTGDGLVPEPR